eukprot:CAMPEP_0113578312 /NCGR_PEP_ID=MMETSP0015_2-20120614/29405_1 /TAXON_ID=2838 /ORGANISM="Odontella" /LENGTH=54 /DNA_ID=CAMNT_0000482091 /DNA_START=139 /DNA_END=303 /DNA_ORIENTATION=- /assembly_acc=CAM_ASM_000160
MTPQERSQGKRATAAISAMADGEESQADPPQTEGRSCSSNDDGPVLSPVVPPAG